MFWRSCKYAGKVLLRSKNYLFWCLCFPLVLGTMFHIAFGNMGESEAFVPIKTAVVLEENGSAEFKEIMEQLSEPGEDQFLEITFATKEKAEKLLLEKEVSGILYEGEEIRLAISADMMEYDKLNQSILQAFVQEFSGSYQAMEKIGATHPEKLMDALEVLKEETQYNTQITYADGNMDESLSYFFNLIAMNCLFGCTAGLNVAVGNQANLSTLARRKRISPVPKLISTIGELTATCFLQFCMVCISIFYLWGVLHVDFGNRLGYVLLAVFSGSLSGVTFGFFVGSFGKASQMTKAGILMGTTMLLCFLSGLMVEGMRLFVERYVPFFNKINPAALISDSLYALAVYESPERYFQNIGTLLLMSAVFSLTGITITRRSRYASL